MKLYAAAAILGAFLIGVGVALISVGLALMVAGAELVAGAYIGAYLTRMKEAP